MLWDHKVTGECFHNLFKLSQTSLSVSTTENMFSISFREFCEKKKKATSIFTFIIKMKNSSLCLWHH